MMSDKTYTVISYYWHEEWDKEVSWQTVEGASFSDAEEVIEHQTSRGFKVRVFEERLVLVNEIDAVEKIESEPTSEDLDYFDKYEYSDDIYDDFEYNFNRGDDWK